MLGAVPALLVELGLVGIHANPLLHLVNVVVWALVALVMFAALKEFATELGQPRATVGRT
ncbi:hypothetical protein NY547_00020 [Cnuibacter physcomitrellae]|uniref:hypothetical protein n=1 Tax=Cnuibacter physcomitrellae TaxID=1619308 RepID=UPI0021757B28|nr:hypothetical protein [Cnuibacter physcomitrellae]MCS5495622.1 hypothetical protein [Cnuibacter physcomitrellae]